MPTLATKETCCGCSACANKCPKAAISMQPDEGGFLNPIVNHSLCVECGACEKVCPALGTISDDTKRIDAYLIQHSDEEIRSQSTSGGAFTAFAQVILSEGGVIYGAIMTEDNVVKHDYVEKVEDLAKFRNSKYVQSQIRDTYKDIKKRLVSGELVCFSGTPCQIAGLKYYLGKDYSNLFTVDVVCHAIPSPLVFSKYVEFTKKRLPNAHRLVFRDKKRGYSYSTMAWYDKNGKNIYRASYELDEWYRLFLHDKCDRNSCYDCKYQNQPRLSDITIWDCYNAHDICPELDDNKGTTNVIVWTDRGADVIGKACKYAKIVKIDSKLTYGSTINHKREKPEWNLETFYKDANSLPVEEFFGKYVPRTMKARLASAMRYTLWKVGLHDVVRRAIQARRKG